MDLNTTPIPLVCSKGPSMVHGLLTNLQQVLDDPGAPGEVLLTSPQYLPVGKLAAISGPDFILLAGYGPHRPWRELTKLGFMVAGVDVGEPLAELIDVLLQPAEPPEQPLPHLEALARPSNSEPQGPASTRGSQGRGSGRQRGSKGSPDSGQEGRRGSKDDQDNGSLKPRLISVDLGNAVKADDKDAEAGAACPWLAPITPDRMLAVCVNHNEQVLSALWTNPHEVLTSSFTEPRFVLPQDDQPVDALHELTGLELVSQAGVTDMDMGDAEWPAFVRLEEEMEWDGSLYQPGTPLSKVGIQATSIPMDGSSEGDALQSPGIIDPSTRAHQLMLRESSTPVHMPHSGRGTGGATGSGEPNAEMALAQARNWMRDSLSKRGHKWREADWQLTPYQEVDGSWHVRWIWNNKEYKTAKGALIAVLATARHAAKQKIAEIEYELDQDSDDEEMPYGATQEDAGYDESEMPPPGDDDRMSDGEPALDVGAAAGTEEAVAKGKLEMAKMLAKHGREFKAEEWEVQVVEGEQGTSKLVWFWNGRGYKSMVGALNGVLKFGTKMKYRDPNAPGRRRNANKRPHGTPVQGGGDQPPVHVQAKGPQGWLPALWINPQQHILALEGSPGAQFVICDEQYQPQDPSPLTGQQLVKLTGSGAHNWTLCVRLAAIAIWRGMQWPEGTTFQRMLMITRPSTGNPADLHPLLPSSKPSSRQNSLANTPLNTPGLPADTDADIKPTKRSKVHQGAGDSGGAGDEGWLANVINEALQGRVVAGGTAAEPNAGLPQGILQLLGNNQGSEFQGLLNPQAQQLLEALEAGRQEIPGDVMPIEPAPVAEAPPEGYKQPIGLNLGDGPYHP